MRFTRGDAIAVQHYHPVLVEGAGTHSAATPDVRVGIVSWNTAQLLDRCLTSLPAALGDLRAEIVVVDNASSDGSARVARSHPGVEVRARGQNSGYAVAMNEALSGTSAPTLIALNPDTEAPPGSLAALAADLVQDPSLGLVVPTLVDGDGRPQRSIYPFPGILTALENGFVPPGLRRPWPVSRLRLRSSAGGQAGDDILRRQWAVGAVHCIRAAALAGRAPYCARWFMYAEDIELCWWLRRAGWRLAQRHDVAVVHHGNAAGQQRWGTGATLELRSLPNIYDWLWTDRSAALGRATAAVNVAGVSSKELALRLGVAAYRGRGPAADRWMGRAAELATLRQYHAAVLAGGPRGVDEPPPGS